ncbi:MAG: hypothetical protein NTW87_23910 [Planctomycetota bacterium]|nr:hypothetical protein [Planctomycetota bacterium]
MAESFSKFPRTLGTCLTLMVLAASTCPAVEETGFGIGPGMILVENIQPGAPEVDVFGKTDLAFEVHNGTNKAHTFSVAVIKPRAAIASWEIGYEEIPDPSWCRLDKAELDLPAQTDGKVKLFIKVPDKPEYYNRKWMALVVCRPGKPTPGSVGLQVGARVQIETLAKADTDGVGAGPLALAPSVVRLEAKPGDSVEPVVKFRNNTAKEHTYTLLRLDEAEKDAAKHERYFGPGCVQVIKPSWLTPDGTSFALKPGETKELKIKVSVPKNAEPGKRYEELLFLKDEAGGVDFLRVRTEIPAAAKDKP